MNVAVFGGGFNPPHLGHQVMCLMLLEACPIDEVWLVPTYQNYLGKELLDFEDRVRLCEQLVLPFGKGVRIETIEQELADGRTDGNRMLDTLTALQRRHADVQLRLVVGADILSESERWYRWQDVIALAPPIVFCRHGYQGGTWPAPPTISSRLIRARLRTGEEVKTMVPARVLQLIEKKGLYR